MSTRSERQAVYVSKRWRRLRRSVLASSRRRCAICGRAGRLEVDHLIPMFDGGETWAIANLQALCRGCHFAKTARENLRRPRAIPPEPSLAWDNLVSGIEKTTV